MATKRPAGSYGVDAPWVPWLWLGLGALFLIFGVALSGGHLSAWRIILLGYFYGGAVVLFAGAFFYLYATYRGKFDVWSGELDRLALAGDERALDIGCGRGAVTVQLAKRLPHGSVTGIDLWRSVDQSGNDLAATRKNLELNDVADRVELHTGDMTSLPFGDASFDVVTASLSIHNVPTKEGRRAAVQEALRVLKPGGELVIVDISKVAEYKDVLRERSLVPQTDQNVGWRMWWSGPWMGTRILTAVAPRP
jgi:SAM-dependent methyltransferase